MSSAIPWLKNRGPLPYRVDGELRTDVVHRTIMQGRRERNLRDGRCINDTNTPTHGPLVDGGVRCAHCKLVHKYGAEAVRARSIPESEPLLRRAS